MERIVIFIEGSNLFRQNMPILTLIFGFNIIKESFIILNGILLKIGSSVKIDVVGMNDNQNHAAIINYPVQLLLPDIDVSFPH